MKALGGGRRMKTSWTVDDVVALKPCVEYHRKRIAELWAGRESLDFRQVAALGIPIEDRLWLLLTPPAVERIVARAVRNHALHCGVAAVETWAQRWLSGEDRSAVAAEEAWKVATTAAESWSAVRAAARAAAEAAFASWEASWEEAWKVAATAAEAARAAAEAESARTAERELQLADCIAVFEEADA